MRNLTFGVLAVLAACGPDTGVASSSDVRASCKTSCQYEVDCLGEDAAACADDCVMRVNGWIRTDALEDYSTCHGSLACDADDDACLVKITPLDVHQAWEKRCRAQLEGCDADLDALCTAAFDPAIPSSGFIRFIAPAIVSKYTACLDGADCTARLDCISGVSERYGIDF